VNPSEYVPLLFLEKPWDKVNDFRPCGEFHYQSYPTRDDLYRWWSRNGTINDQHISPFSYRKRQIDQVSIGMGGRSKKELLPIRLNSEISEKDFPNFQFNIGLSVASSKKITGKIQKKSLEDNRGARFM